MTDIEFSINATHYLHESGEKDYDIIAIMPEADDHPFDEGVALLIRRWGKIGLSGRYTIETFELDYRYKTYDDVLLGLNKKYNDECYKRERRRYMCDEKNSCSFTGSLSLDAFTSVYGDILMIHDSLDRIKWQWMPNTCVNNTKLCRELAIILKENFLDGVPISEKVEDSMILFENPLYGLF